MMIKIVVIMLLASTVGADAQYSNTPPVYRPQQLPPSPVNIPPRPVYSPPQPQPQPQQQMTSYQVQRLWQGLISHKSR